MMMSLIAGCGEKKEAEPNDGFDVHVYVKNESGNAVSGVTVQACDDSVCMVAKTNDAGCAGFNSTTKTLEVHMLKVPAGFAEDKTVYHTDEKGNLTVTLKAAS